MHRFTDDNNGTDESVTEWKSTEKKSDTREDDLSTTGESRAYNKRENQIEQNKPDVTSNQNVSYNINTTEIHRKPEKYTNISGSTLLCVYEWGTWAVLPSESTSSKTRRSVEYDVMILQPTGVK